MTKYKGFDIAIRNLTRDRGVLSYLLSIEQISWMLFLKFLDSPESKKLKRPYGIRKRIPLLEKRFRWSEWACPKNPDGSPDKSRMKSGDALIEFVNEELFPYLSNFPLNSDSEPGHYSHDIDMLNVRNRVQCGKSLRKVLNFVDKIDFSSESDRKSMADAYESLLRYMGETPGRATKYYTPRTLIRTIVKAINPESGETVFDAASGSCGFLINAFEHVKLNSPELSEKQLNALQSDALFGYERSPSIYLLGLMNMVFHGISSPVLKNGNVFSQDIRKINERNQYDIVFANMPFNEQVDPQHKKNYPIKHNDVEVLYLQFIMSSLKSNGRAAIVVPEHLLSGAGNHYRKLRKKLLKNYDLHTILSLPPNTFSPFSNVKADVLFFDRKGKTSNIWYYECAADLNPSGDALIYEKQLQEFLDLYSTRETTRHSWMVPVERLKYGFNLKPHNPTERKNNRKKTKNYLKDENSSEYGMLSSLVKETNDSLVQYLNEWYRELDRREVVSELLEFKVGRAKPKEEDYSEDKTDFPILRFSECYEKGFLDHSKIRYLTQEAFDKTGHVTVSDQDLIIRFKGKMSDYKLSECHIVPIELYGSVITDDMAKLTIKDRMLLDLEFLKLFTLTEDFKRQLFSASAMGEYPNIIESKFMNVEIPLCPIEDQQKLVRSVRLVKELLDDAKNLKNCKFLNGHDKLGSNIAKINDIQKILNGLHDSVKTVKLDKLYRNGSEIAHFKSQVQSNFLLLMLADDRISCMPYGPIREIQFSEISDSQQFDAEFAEIKIEDVLKQKNRELSVWMEPSVDFTVTDGDFGSFLSEAWKKFNDPCQFSLNLDGMVIVTDVNQTDGLSVINWLLKQARLKNSCDEFLNEVEHANHESNLTKATLNGMILQVKNANDGGEVTNEEIHGFLKHLHVLRFDIGSDPIAVPESANSLISKFGQSEPTEVWANIVKFVQSKCNIREPIGIEDVPRKIKSHFEEKIFKNMPEEFRYPPQAESPNLSNHPFTEKLAALSLLGSWDEDNSYDQKVLQSLLGIEFDEWSSKAEKLLSKPDAPLSKVYGTWTVLQRKQLLNQYASQMTDCSLKIFENSAFNVITETPAYENFDSPYQSVADIYDSPKYSLQLCEGISEGLALLGNNSELFNETVAKYASEIPVSIVRKLLSAKSGDHWEKYGRLLPNLAEAAPSEFLAQLGNAIEIGKDSESIQRAKYLRIDQHSPGFQVSGLHRALEALAWNEIHLAKVCTLLEKLTGQEEIDRGFGPSFHSIMTILLPWSPHTLAHLEIRKSVVRAILKENNHIGWMLLLKFLPNLDTATMGTYKPRFIHEPKEGWNNKVSHQEYWKFVTFSCELLVSEIGKDSNRLVRLLELIDYLPESAYDKLIAKLKGRTFMNLSESKKLEIWEKLTKFIVHQKKNSGYRDSLSADVLSQLELVTKNLAPKDASKKYQYLFTKFEWELFEEYSNLENQADKLEERRINAVNELLRNKGMDAVLDFASSVESPGIVGHTLAKFNDPNFDKRLPDWLRTADSKLIFFVRGYIWTRHQINGWEWVDNLPIKSWTNEQIGLLFASLPFENDTWKRVEKWLKQYESAYWRNTHAFPHRQENFGPAIEKLIQYGRANDAMRLLSYILRHGRKFKSNLSIPVLLSLGSNTASIHPEYHNLILKLISLLQADAKVDRNTLLEIELMYLPLFTESKKIRPIIFENKLANDPEFFCQIIEAVHGSRKSELMDQNLRSNNYSYLNHVKFALRNWKTIPGTENSEKFNKNRFKKWLQHVRKNGLDAQTLGVALNTIGNVLVHAPEDKNGLWIDRTIAEALNERDVGDLRGGYRVGILNNSMGSPTHSSNGANGKDLAKTFQSRAKSIENEGYHLFAQTLREIAEYPHSQYETQHP